MHRDECGQPCPLCMQRGGGEECTAPLHCVGVSLDMLRPLSLDYKTFQEDFSRINTRKMLCNVNGPNPGNVLFSLLKRELLKT